MNVFPHEADQDEIENAGNQGRETESVQDVVDSLKKIDPFASGLHELITRRQVILLENRVRDHLSAFGGSFHQPQIDAGLAVRTSDIHIL